MRKKQSESEARMGPQDASLLFNPSHPAFKFLLGSEMPKKYLSGSSCFQCASVAAGPCSITARQVTSEVADPLAQEKRNDPQPLLGSEIPSALERTSRHIRNSE